MKAVYYFLYYTCGLLLMTNLGCSPKFQVGSDFNPQANFNQYQTFAEDRRDLFKKRSNPILNSELTEKRINYAIARQLQAKGYAESLENPDLIYEFQTQVQSRQEVQRVNNFPPAWGYYSRWYNPAFAQDYVRDYEETTLIINVREADSKELVWQGWVIGELKYTASDWAEQINNTIAKALAEFPVRSD